MNGLYLILLHYYLDYYLEGFRGKNIFVGPLRTDSLFQKRGGYLKNIGPFFFLRVRLWIFKYFYVYAAKDIFLSRGTVDPRYNEVLRTMKITLLYQVSHYIR